MLSAPGAEDYTFFALTHLIIENLQTEPKSGFVGSILASFLDPKAVRKPTREAEHQFGSIGRVH